MRKGVMWWIVGFLIGLVGAFIPVLGIPLVILGGIICMIGFFIFFFGAGKKVVSVGGKGASAVASVTKSTTGNKSGTGTL